ncbi:saccharopine dehydrogenase-like NADP-dependent oxidoreductase [Nitrospirillum amazonense]|uniref:Saccharopine dehydrogenase-like NADP-dependent oxidoreductase n=1 Tax=Nitrospirillum amazonense TaxID=28077 RepID=A0A560F6K8_9PROT|nr:saccharopine dehydrogenase C-terminal domain-containing protein [Nitrospirillum amazonense]TWB17223.1 saccharopine dehydrogenase-like NADP-dependent oxidoreductase [Nitrospirillum amazonense]
MRRIVVVGAGKIGSIIAENLAGSGDFLVTVLDRSAKALEGVSKRLPIERREVDISDVAALTEALTGAYAVLSAAPYHLTIKVAEAAAIARCHYLDLTEDVATTRRVKELAANAPNAFIPQCGLAPGFISIVAGSLAKKFDTLEAVRLRVGALPRYASNSLGYNLTWSTDGVINEYCEPCEAIVEGTLREVPALEEREEFWLDGVPYEAFNTSGGLGSLAEVLKGRVRTLNYKTIRYPGHCQLMKTLLNDLRLRDRRDLFKTVLEGALPATMQDVVVIFVTVSGMLDGQLTQESYSSRVFGDYAHGRQRTAIQTTTAAGICAVLDMLADGRLPAHGFIRQEDIALDDFLANRFGRAYQGANPVDQVVARVA